MKRTKKSLVFVLAVAMMLTLIPASVFATTTNEVVKVVTVAADEDMPTIGMDLRVTNASGIDKGSDQVFRLTLENATWRNEDNAIVATSKGDMESGHKDAEGNKIFPDIFITEAANSDAETTQSAIKITSYGDNSLEVTVTPKTKIEKDGYFHIDMNLTSGEDSGEVKVVVESNDSEISSGSYVVATVAGGDTIGKVVTTPKKVTRGKIAQQGATIEIRESAVNSVGATNTQVVKLTLPKGFEWNEKAMQEVDEEKDVYMHVKGSMIDGQSRESITIERGDKRKEKPTDARDLFITFTADGAPSLRETLVIEPYIDVTRDAKTGDVSVQIRAHGGDISDESGLVIATYGDDGVTVSPVKEKDLPTITAGFALDESGDVYTVKVTLEEVTPLSLIDNKYVEFEFPQWVQLAFDTDNEEFPIKVKLNGTEVKGKNLKDVEKLDDVDKADVTKDTSVVEWTVDREGWGFKTDKTNKVEFEFPITIEAQHSGDLELIVRGPKAGVDEAKIVVAKVVEPITAEVNIADVRTGIQSQAAGTIIIKETEPGMIRETESYDYYDHDSKDKGWKDDGERNLVISISDLGFNGMQFDSATVKVTKGDLEIDEDKVEVNDYDIVIPIERSSIREAAEITISDVALNLSRVLPEGNYNVKVKGGSVVDNSYYKKDDFTSNAVSEKYINIITPADGNVYGTAKFQLGAKEYSVLINGKEQTYQMDTAAFTQNQRTMIPVKFVALALGVSEDNVVWNGTAKTATFFKGDRVCVLTAGSNIMNVNGAEVVMDTNAFVKDKRIFVPIKYVANALGCSVEWDGTTKTVTINQ